MTPLEARTAVEEYARTGSQHAVAKIVRAAPPMLATTILASVFSAGKASTLSLAIAEGAIQTMRSAKWILTAVLGGTAVVVVLVPLILWQIRTNVSGAAPEQQAP